MNRVAVFASGYFEPFVIVRHSVIINIVCHHHHSRLAATASSEGGNAAFRIKSVTLYVYVAFAICINDCSLESDSDISAPCAERNHGTVFCRIIIRFFRHCGGIVSFFPFRQHIDELSRCGNILKNLVVYRCDGSCNCHPSGCHTEKRVKFSHIHILFVIIIFQNSFKGEMCRNLSCCLFPFQHTVTSEAIKST